MSSMPEGWQDPKTNWSPEDPVGPGDLTRIERNAQAIELGDRTVDPAQAPAGNIGTLGQILSWIANRIKAITGGANWWSTPATTLAGAKGHMDAAAPHSGHETPSGAQNKVQTHATEKLTSGEVHGVGSDAAGIYYLASGRPYASSSIWRDESATDDTQNLVVGPPGSGADIEWQALQAVPAEATALRLNLTAFANHGTSATQDHRIMLEVAELNGYSNNRSVSAYAYVSGERSAAHNSVTVGLTNRKFRVDWVKVHCGGSTASLFASIYLEGWYA